MKKFMQFIFSIRNIENHKVVTIFGFKIKFPRVKNDLSNEALLLDLKTQIMASKVNYNLIKYKNCNEGKDVIIIGGGATLKYYQNVHSSGKKVFVGINRAYKMSEIAFDYLFSQDMLSGIDESYNFINYRPESCKKFIGHITVPNTTFRYRINLYAQVKNQELYILDNKRMGEIPLNITLEPFADLCGTVFSVLQFILYTNPKRIYLYGFDCNRSHSFEFNEGNMGYKYQYPSWLKFKDYIDKNTYNVEIISVNPVGLKGLFKDVYTQSYVQSHPELLKENIEILYTSSATC